MIDNYNPQFAGKEDLLDSAPDIWPSLKRSIAKQIAESLINELSGRPSNHRKLIHEQIMNTPWIRKAA